MSIYIMKPFIPPPPTPPLPLASPQPTAAGSCMATPPQRGGAGGGELWGGGGEGGGGGCSAAEGCLTGPPGPPPSPPLSRTALGLPPPEGPTHGFGFFIIIRPHPRGGEAGRAPLRASPSLHPPQFYLNFFARPSLS
nr:hypothetical protein [Morchella crassipes]